MYQSLLSAKSVTISIISIIIITIRPHCWFCLSAFLRCLDDQKERGKRKHFCLRIFRSEEVTGGGQEMVGTKINVRTNKFTSEKKSDVALKKLRL